MLHLASIMFTVNYRGSLYLHCDSPCSATGPCSHDLFELFVPRQAPLKLSEGPFQRGSDWSVMITGRRPAIWFFLLTSEPAEGPFFTSVHCSSNVRRCWRCSFWSDLMSTCGVSVCMYVCGRFPFDLPENTGCTGYYWAPKEVQCRVWALDICGM